MEQLRPFVDEFELQDPFTTRSKTSISQHALNKLLPRNSVNPNEMTSYPNHSLPQIVKLTPWWYDLLSKSDRPIDRLPDYYVTTLVKEHCDKSLTSFEPVSTAFVTFSDPADARRACGWLAAHPNNPLSCLVTKAYSDLESWNPRSELKYVEALICSHGSRCSRSYLVDQRLDCKSWRLVRIRIERLLSIGLRLLRGFTLFWLFPVSLLVGLVSIQSTSLFRPSLVCVSYILLEQGTHS